MSDKKLLSVTVPCYNSQDYMEHCLQTLLSGGEDIEILIVDDGSADDTAAIADRWAVEHPAIVRVVHQENKGHGGAVMTGLRNASGVYFKVVDSDDWVDEAVFRRTMETLRQLAAKETPVDLLVTNYIYDKVGLKRHAIRYGSAFRPGRVLTWAQVGHFFKWENLLMHALIYRTELLRSCGLSLPEHTFYVDNLYATIPLASVETIYYLNADLYHYYIGREGQSVQEATMIRRIDQQIRVNKLMLDGIDLEHVRYSRQRSAIFHYHDIITAVTSILLIIAGSEEHLRKKDELWAYIRENHPWEYKKLRYSLFGVVMNLQGKLGRGFAVVCYRIANKVFGFN